MSESEDKGRRPKRSRPAKQISGGERPKWTDVALFACAAAAMVISFWQWQVAARQLEFAVRSASGSSRDTQAALLVSRRIALASEKQAADAANSASAAQRSADAASLQIDEFRHQTTAVVRQANALIATKGVKHGRFTVTTSGHNLP